MDGADTQTGARFWARSDIFRGQLICSLFWVYCAGLLYWPRTVAAQSVTVDPALCRTHTARIVRPVDARNPAREPGAAS